jgi:hypothetical protein
MAEGQGAESPAFYGYRIQEKGGGLLVLFRVLKVFRRYSRWTLHLESRQERSME